MRLPGREYVAIYIEAVPNRGSPPAVLLRESYRLRGKVRKRTLANLSEWPPALVEGLRALLKGGAAVARLDEAFDIARSRPHGHVAAVLGTLKRLRLDRLIAPRRSPERDRAVAMIVARVLDPGSKLATARGLAGAAARDTLAETLGLGAVDVDGLYAAMDWLLERQGRIERALARRHLEEGALALYDLTSVWMEGRKCPLARRGHSRDGKRGKLQIEFGLLCDGEGRPAQGPAQTLRRRTARAKLPLPARQPGHRHQEHRLPPAARRRTVRYPRPAHRTAARSLPAARPPAAIAYPVTIR